jgi:hypothetical protein
MRRTLVVAGFLLVAGCAGAIPRPADAYTDGRALLIKHRESREQLTRLQAEARVDQRGQAGRIKGSVLMFVERPARVRLDVMTQFGPIAIFTSDGQQFAYSDLREQRYLSGPTCPENIARLLGVGLTAEETTSILLGGTPLIAALGAAIEWNDDGFYRVKLRAADGTQQQIDLEPWAEDRTRPRAEQHLRLLRSELFDPKGRSVWRFSYEDYQPVGDAARGIEMAYRVRVEQPTEGNDTLIRFKELRLDPAIPEGAFTQQPRAGMRLEPSSCAEPALEPALTAEPEPVPEPVPVPAPAPDEASQ